MIVDEHVTWDVTPGFPYGGIYNGLDNVVENFFGRLASKIDTFSFIQENFYLSENSVLVTGYYTGRAIATGIPFKSRFVHVWTLYGEKIVAFRQTADTWQVQLALSPPDCKP